MTNDHLTFHVNDAQKSRHTHYAAPSNRENILILVRIPKNPTNERFWTQGSFFFKYHQIQKSFLWAL